ncbi:MAG: hypothetical protein ACTSQX_12020 [Candidatus Heimdallarchaeota archaeon]
MNPRIVSLRKISTLFLLTIILMLVYVSPSNAEIFTKTTEEENEGSNINVLTSIPEEFSTDFTIQSFDPIETGTFESSSTISGITWGNDTIIQSPYQPDTPSIVVDSNDTTHLCWAIYNGGPLMYHAMLFENGTVDINLLESHVGGAPIKLDTVADNFGRIHLAYSYGENAGHNKIYYRVWDKGVWSDAERVDYSEDDNGNTVPAHTPQIAVDSAGIPHIIWSAEVFSTLSALLYHRLFYQRKLGEDSWSNVLFAGYGKPGSYRMVISSDNTLHVGLSYKEGETYGSQHKVYYLYKENNDTDWINAHQLLSILTDLHLLSVPPPALAVVNNTLYFYFVAAGLYSQEIYEMVRKDGVWGSTTLITNNVTYHGHVSLEVAINKAGDKNLVWTNNEDFGPQTMYYKTYSHSLDVWSNDFRVSVDQDRTYHTTLAIDSKDNYHLVWRDFHPVSGYALYYKYGIADSDMDGLSNDDEKNVYFTNPYDPDTDDDLMLDGAEIAEGMDPFDPDEDVDLILDGWEFQYGFDPWNATDATVDFDLDSLTNLEEFNVDTNPNLWDTDSDGLSDGDEVLLHSTDPNNPDSDFDELNDGDELIEGTDPLDSDSEDDGMPDGYEVANSLDPLVNDSYDDADLEGLLNIYEYYNGTDPNDNDTEDDGLTDFEEVVIYTTNPLSNDTDHDNLTDYYEVTLDPLDNTYLTNNTYQTNPLLADSDFDLLWDIVELNISLTNPLLNDTDLDLMLDGYEHLMGLDPFTDDADADYDTDGLTNYQESLYWSDPFDPDSDDDGLSDFEESILGTDLMDDDTDDDWLTDYMEIRLYDTNATNPDTDFDFLNDFYEVRIYISNPRINDTDGDTLWDGLEVYNYSSSPTNVDTDGDGLTDPIEVAYNSALNMVDTDYDGMDDFWEWTYGFDPQFDNSNEDPDADQLINIQEYYNFANPLLNDTDFDQINDYLEVFKYFTYPNVNDTDTDGLYDFEEIFTYNTSAIDPDTDDDLLTDGEEILIYKTSPFLADTDGDGFTDYEEIVGGTDPLNPRSNPQKRLLVIISSVAAGTIGILLFYYMTPYVFNRFSSGSEKDWIDQGIESREQKHRQILEVTEPKLEE